MIILHFIFFINFITNYNLESILKTYQKYNDVSVNGPTVFKEE